MTTFCHLLTARGWGVIRRFYHPKTSNLKQNSLSHSSMHRIPAQIAFAGLTSKLASEQSRVLTLSALNQGKRLDEKRRVKERRHGERHGSVWQQRRPRMQKGSMPGAHPLHTSNHCRTSQQLGDLSLLKNFTGA